MTPKETPEQVFRKRLGTLVSKGGADGRDNMYTFAKRCGLSSSRRVTDWLNKDGTKMPNADNLRSIGKAYGRSVDWLLGFDVPEVRGVTRTKREIEDDLAIYVEREIATRMKGKGEAAYLAHMSIDGAELLKTAIEEELSAIKRASRTADLYTQSGAKSISEIVQKTTGKKKVRFTWLDRIAFHAAIFQLVLLERSKSLRSNTTLRRKRESRPLLELSGKAISISPDSFRTLLSAASLSL